jgi:hypothetical protein
VDGATLYRSLRESIGEPSGSQYMDYRTGYQLLWDAAIELTRRTKALKATQTITTVAGTTTYVLNADFLEMDLKDTNGVPIIKYYDGTSTYWIQLEDYHKIVRSNNTSAIIIPSCFAIIDKESLYSQITGTATSGGSTSANVSTLTDTSGLFTTTDYVSAGDVVHNSTQSDSGIILSVTSATSLQTAMFDTAGGSSTGWTADDAYVIQPQGRLQIVLDSPPYASGHVITVYYLQRPAPVFHDYGVYRFPSHYQNALVDYAASRYKLRDREPSMWDVYRKEWSGRIGAVGEATNRAMSRKGFKMSLSGRR